MNQKVGEKVKTIPVNEVVYREDLYPRIKTSATTVQVYSQDIERMPPIEVNQHNELIDGWHRWTAHKTVNAAEIKAFVTDTKDDMHLLELAIRRNAEFGLQMSSADKKSSCLRFYKEDPIPAKHAWLADLFSVGISTVKSWCADMDRSQKADRNRRIFEMWLACWTQTEIAEKIGVDQRTIDRNVGVFPALEMCLQSDAETGGFKVAEPTDGETEEAFTARIKAENASASQHSSDFDIPLYNVWTYAKKTNEVSHFGNTEPTIVDNLLYLYTEPFDIVVDPFAGSGSTIDVCRKRFRRYWVSDRKPIPARAAEIHKHDVIGENGKIELPQLPKGYWSDVSLVYLDPPYWKQAEGEYSDAPTDLANMDKETFTKAMADLVMSLSKKMTKGGYIAMVMQPTQWRAQDKEYTDHILDICGAVKIPVHIRIQAPYSTQQCTPQMVNWAKDNREILVLSREVVVWSV